jgi:hypothetical protein
MYLHRNLSLKDDHVWIAYLLLFIEVIWFDNLNSSDLEVC